MSFLVNDVFPAGIVLPYAGATAPDGWLLCNGQTVSQTQYKRLFDAVGPTFNNGSEPVGHFRLPDTRGVFLRGAGSQTISGITYSGTIGAKQTDQLQSHLHDGTPSGNLTTSAQTSGTVIGARFSNYSGVPSVADGANGTPRYGSETRPANIGVNHIIKI